MSPTKPLCLSFFLLLLVSNQVVTSYDYTSALKKSILFFEAQRSGRLPPNQRVTWRGDSALHDGSDAGVDLVGGYYDAGDHVKYGFPLAYSITMLAWGVMEFREQLAGKGELDNVLATIKWGTDYMLKTHVRKDAIYGAVGNGDTDHICWERPEDMDTPRTSYLVDADHPASDFAASTAAALAASALVLRYTEDGYSTTLIHHARTLYDFALAHPGLYHEAIPSAQKFYHSSDQQDDLLWGASWLYRATQEERFLDDIKAYNGTGGYRGMFSWDDTYVGVQLFIAKMVLDGRLPNEGKYHDYKVEAEDFICNMIGKGNSNVKKSYGGLAWFNTWNNFEYTTSAAFIITVYGQYLTDKVISMKCPVGDAPVNPNELFNFAQSQLNYILGQNPKRMSYMVGFGENYPKRIHHRAASIVSFKTDSAPVTCQGGIKDWLNRDAPDPNVLEGAVVGGPDDQDQYRDTRSNYNQVEPSLTNNAPLVGVLAKFA